LGVKPRRARLFVRTGAERISTSNMARQTRFASASLVSLDFAIRQA